MTGPYKDMPSHGIAYDVWAGLVQPEIDDDGFAYIPEHASIGINAGPLFGALGVLAGIIRARATGEGCQLEIAQSDAAAAIDWLRSETWKAYERPESEVTGNEADDYERRAPGTAGMRDGVRYQFYETTDGHMLFMASEREFWKNFCEGVGRPDLFERAGLEVRRPRARQHRAARASCATSSRPHDRRVARVRRRAQHADRPGQHAEDDRRRPAVPGPVPVAPDRARSAPSSCRPRSSSSTRSCRCPTKAPTVGEHTDEVLRDVLGYDDDQGRRARGVRRPRLTDTPAPNSRFCVR